MWGQWRCGRRTLLHEHAVIRLAVSQATPPPPQRNITVALRGGQQACHVKRPDQTINYCRDSTPNSSHTDSARWKVALAAGIPQ